MNSHVLDTLGFLSESHEVRITPDPEPVFTPVVQPEDPFETTVRVIRESKTTAVPPDDAVKRRASERDCVQKEILFEPPPTVDDAAYATYRRTWPDDTVTGGRLHARNSFDRGSERTPTETEVALIEHIELL